MERGWAPSWDEIAALALIRRRGGGARWLAAAALAALASALLLAAYGALTFRLHPF